jgi:coniferyl-aldehyde dehydrogenase
MLADAVYSHPTHLETERLQALFERQRSAFQAYPSPTAADRLQWLEALHDLLFARQSSAAGDRCHQ